jgi:UDP-N-acetylglucosamine 4,6-dehydratase
MSITDLAKAIAPECRLKTVGIRPGEKLHEVMISEDDSRNTTEFKDHYVIWPAFYHPEKKYRKGNGVPDGFRYSSDSNSRWLTVKDLRALVAGRSK